MNSSDYRNFLLSNIPRSKKASGGKEVQCRCRYCSDSHNLNNIGHFYISIPGSNEDLSFFNCYKCHSSGIVTNRILLEWGIYDPQIGIELTIHNKVVMCNPKNKIYDDNIIYNIKYSHVTNDDLTKYKLEYINNRLGTNFDYDYCIKNKIVLNLNDLLQENRLQGTRNISIMEQLDSSFIGFLSVNNAFVNMRKLTDKPLPTPINKKYINYSLFNKYDNTHRFYVIPTHYDLTKPIKLHLSEGPFDSLGIYHNLVKEIDNNIYSNIGGSGYKGIIKYFINTLRLPNLEINYYPDADINQEILLDISDTLEPFHFPFSIHRNEINKDFGVRKDQIKEIQFKIR